MLSSWWMDFAVYVTPYMVCSICTLLLWVYCSTSPLQVSRTFDPFLFLSLPLPVKTERTLYVYVVRADPDQPVYRVSVCSKGRPRSASL